MNDLNAASLDDVKNWFRSWYGPNNAVLVLAGDIDLQTAKQKATEVFRRYSCVGLSQEIAADDRARSDTQRVKP